MRKLCVCIHIKFIVVFAYIFIRKLMDGWMTCNFTSFSTVFQSYIRAKNLRKLGACFKINVYICLRKLQI